MSVAKKNNVCNDKLVGENYLAKHEKLVTYMGKITKYAMRGVYADP